jgi:hypothetical protein
MSIIADEAFRGRYGLTSWPVVRAVIEPSDSGDSSGPLTVPDDAIANLGRTREVLLDEPFGLVPRAVKTGQSLHGRTEIMEGLCEGQHVVRNLEQLAVNCQRINAILVGLWDNGVGWWEAGRDP